MKLLQFAPVLLLSAVSIVACNNEKKDATDETVKTDTIATVTTPTATVVYAGDGNRTVVQKSEVPATVTTTFETKFPKADKVEWVKYDPVAEDYWDTEKDYYFANYYIGDQYYTTWYDPEGTWIKTSTPFKDINGLPMAVSKAIAEGFPGFEVVEVDKENDKDMDMYEVEMKKGEEKAKVKFLPNGDVFKAKVN